MARIPRPDVTRVWGLDLSIRRSAAVMLPFDFVAGDGSLLWGAVHFGTSRGEQLSREAPERDRIARNIETAGYVETMIGNMAAFANTRVYVEDYAYGAAYESARIGEVTGLVKAGLWKLAPELAPVPANMASARKLFLGKLSRGVKPKEAVERACKLIGVPFDTQDEMDAFVVANYGLSEQGFKAVMLTPEQWGGS
jgi:hypothetical protein